MATSLYLKTMNKDFLTRDEVAKILGISTRTVSRRVKEGKLNVRRHKGQLRFPIEQFDDVKQEQKDTTKELISILQKQLIEKDIQINKLQEDTKVKALENQLKEKDKQIGDLSRALNNQQGLTKDITDKILLLPDARKEKPEEKPEKRQEKRQKPKKPRKKPRKSKAKKNNLLKRIFST
jgi:excisionase family DNA binding protein